VAARPLRLTIAGAALSALVTVLVTVLPFVRFAYRGPAMHVALETIASSVAILVAYLVFWRVRRHGRASDLALFAALAILASANLLFSAVPAALGHATETFPTWTQAGGRLLGAIALAAAAFAPDRRLRRPDSAALMVMGSAVAMLAVVAAGVALAGPSLPDAIDPGLSPEASGRPRIVGHPAILGLQVVMTVLCAAAAAGFARSARRGADELMGWLALASTFGAFARVNYFLFPSLYSDWVYTGDLFRLGFFLVLMVGAFREIQNHQRDLIEAAELRERRRVARALHDGLAHELAFVVTQSRRLAAAGEPDDPGLRHLAAAAERALDESRDAIAALGRPVDMPLGELVAEAALDVAARFDVELRLDVADSGEADRDTREGLIRIVREAVTNAARHGAARAVDVELRRDGALRLRIVDDGIGFDPAAPPHRGRGFGLTSMRERAEAAGGVLHVASRPGAGTQIEVVVP
jgi:signal transduction histidine kinase